MGYDGNFTDTILSIYDAAIESDGWAAAIGNITGHVGGDGGLFVGFSWTGDFVSILHSVGASPESDRSYREKWLRNPWADRAVRQPIGTAFANEALIDTATLERTNYYQDFLRPIDIMHGLSSCLAGDPNFLAGITISRSHRAGAYDQSEIETFGALVPHLQRAAQIQLRLTGWDPLATAALDLLDCLSLGVVLLDARGDMLFANEAARRLAGRCDGLRLDGGRISAATAPDRATLERLITDALNLGRHEVSAGGGGMTVARAGGRTPLHLLVTPLVGAAATALAGTGVAIFIRDPDDRSRQDSTLQQLFDLTPAEARVAALIAAGSGIAAAARATGIGRNTVKTHLARIFAKTGVRRQSELAALVGSLPHVSI